MRSSLHLVCQLTLTMTIASNLHAAEEIQDSVPLDLVKALLGTNNPFEIRIYSDVPDNFPEIEIPDTVELLGSADLGHSQQLVMRAEGDGLQPRSQMMTSLERAGYIMLTQAPGSGPAQTGFVTPNFIPPTIPVQFCHDEHGMVTLRITGSYPTSPAHIQGGTTIVSQSFSQGVPFNPFVRGSPVPATGTGLVNTPTTSVIHVTASGGANNPRAMISPGGCAEMLAQFSGRIQPGPSMMNMSLYMPRMELPAAASLPAQGRSPTYTSGAPNGMQSSITMSIDWELETLFTHFTEQISRQDWQMDNQIVGSVSATASWIREVDDTPLLGSLRVIKTADTQYSLQFSVQSLSAQ